MPGLQEWIHKLEEGEGVRFVKLGTALLVVALLTVVYNLREAKNFATEEAMDMSQLARNIARNRGYTTDFVRPISLYVIEEHRADKKALLEQNHPDLANAPVYPVLVAGLMKAMPFQYRIGDVNRFLKYQPEMWIGWFNQAIFFFVALMTFLLARRLFDSSVAWVSLAVLVGCELFWRFSTSGLPMMLLVLFFLTLTFIMVRLEEASRGEPESAPAPEEPGADPVAVPVKQRSAGWYLLRGALAGLLLGLGSLTLYSFGWLILPVLLFYVLFVKERRWQLCGVTLVVFAAVFAPWIVRNFQVSGLPFGTASYAVISDTIAFPDDRLERSIIPEFKELSYKHLYRKLIQNSGEILQKEIPALGGNWVAAFFLVALMMPYRSVRLSRMRIFVLMCLGLLVVVQALGRTHLTKASPEVNSENLLLWLVPMVFIYGVGLFLSLLDQLELPNVAVRFVIMTAFVLLVSAPLILTVLPPAAFPIVYPPYYPPFIQTTASWLEPHELMMSDMPWAVAWYGERQCLWLTLRSPLTDKNDFFAINDYKKRINVITLTPLTLDDKFFTQMVKADKDWGRFVFECLLKKEVPKGFPLPYSPSGYLQDGFFVLSDLERWKQSKR